MKIKINKLNFASVAKGVGYQIEPEVRFAPSRRFKADWKVIKNGKCVLVEYEGINSRTARHTTITGYSKDCEKYNLAQLKGFVVLRYTMLNFDNVFNDLDYFFNSRKI